MATLEGREADAGIMYHGAHYDSVSGSPGGNDNASGVGTMLEIARVMSGLGRNPPLTIKFLAFGGEEAGMLGSNDYVNNHRDELSTAVGMINLDMLGVGDHLGLGTLGVSGTSLRYDTGLLATAMDIAWVPFVAEDNSDHAPFEHAGVQAVFFWEYDDPYNHSSGDTADRLDLDTMQENGVLAAQVLWRWASRSGSESTTAALPWPAAPWSRLPDPAARQSGGSTWVSRPGGACANTRSEDGMKIDKLETWTRRDVSIVRVTTDDGATGFGQISPFTADISAQVFHRQVAPVALGADVADLESLSDRVIEATYKFPGSYVCRALCGLDTALWDLRGKLEGKSVCQLLGGTREYLTPYGSSMRRDITPEDEAARLAGLREKYGFKAQDSHRQGMRPRQDQWPAVTDALLPAVRRAVVTTCPQSGRQ